MNKCKYCGKPVVNKRNFCNIQCKTKYVGYTAANTRYGKIVNKISTCEKCSTTFKYTDRETKEEKRFCCISCARSIATIDSRNKKKYIKCYKCGKKIEVGYRAPEVTTCKKCKLNEHTCIFCGKIVNTRKKYQKYCSGKCGASHYHKQHPDHGIKMGLASSASQKDNRRSKNEMLFYDYCKDHFNNVSCNEAIFNGWDADVIIYDIKYAVLWNGAWHYKKITKKHSIKQVQNRDRIKTNEIIKYGFTPYVIKDMGRFNKNKVKMEFDKFLDIVKKVI